MAVCHPQTTCFKWLHAFFTGKTSVYLQWRKLLQAMMHRQMASTVAQLQAIAAGLARDAGIRIDTAKGHWAWDPVRKVLSVDENDLRNRRISYCAGIVAHEVGHCFLSRYFHFHFQNSLPENIRWHLLNSIEDPRVERWMQLRYKGSVSWFADIVRERIESDIPEHLPNCIIFCLESIKEVALNWQAAEAGTIKPEVAQALQDTRDARRRYVNTVPPTDMNVQDAGYNVDAFYREHVFPDLVDSRKTAPLTPTEKMVQCSAWQALQIAEMEILPVIEGLLTEDEKRLGMQMDQDGGVPLKAQQALDEMIEKTIDKWVELFGEFDKHKHGGEVTAQARRIARECIEKMLEKLCPNPVIHGDSTPTPLPSSGSSSERSMPETRPLLARPKSIPSKLSIQPRKNTTYEREYQLLFPTIDMLAHHLEEVLLPAKRMAERSGYASGSRINLGRFMAFSSDARQYNKLWTRKSLPDRRNTAISLLVDLSGSMQGEKSVAAMHGSILVAEVLNRLAIPFAINGFNDELQPMKGFDQFFGSNVKAQIATIPEISTSKWNDDGPCLAEASEQLLEISVTDHIMVVISDGIPEGRRSDQQDLRDTIATLSDEPSLVLIGVGIGPDTDHVSDYYPEAIANVGIDDFPDALGQLLQRLILARFE